MKKQFYVYSDDGFMFAHTTARAAIVAASREAKFRNVLCTVVRCYSTGYKGAGNGAEIWASNGRVARG